MDKMFCFQCEQTAGGVACTGAKGVCGKPADVAELQDELTGSLVVLAHEVSGREIDSGAAELIELGLFSTVTNNVNFSVESMQSYKDDIESKIREISEEASVQPHAAFDIKNLWTADEDIRSLKSLILFGLRGVAAYAYHARVLGYTDEEVNKGIVDSLAVLDQELGIEDLLPWVLKVGEINLACMELLDKANTETFGHPTPTSVSLVVEPGPFIVVSGHDLYDLKKLLEQTEGKGINIYTHGEMLPAHAYPELKAYAHLKSNFGTAWQNQRKEFDALPAPVLFTTNCLMPPLASYADRVFTTEAVAYDGLVHIGSDRDFSPVIEKALELGGYSEAQQCVGTNGGTQMTTGFGHNAVLSVADVVIDAVKAGALKHIFLVGGCDGAKVGRDYYTEFVEQTPEDTVVLTLACGKYRFNDLEIGTLGGLPRLMDMGQCNDAYSAIKVALALAEAFDCGVNDLPLTLVLSWYEQKAVCILLTLLHLGIKNIYLGPTLPAFISPNILEFLVENYQISPTGDAKEDLAKILS